MNSVKNICPEYFFAMAHRIRIFAITVFSLFFSFLSFSQNPFSPPGVYIADPSAHVWNDGKLYIYGSLDESCDYYCSHRHHVLVTEDMKNWSLYRDALVSKGEGDAVPYNDNVLYAPDAAFSGDTYYIFYCQPDRTNAEGVATSSSPVGPFTNGSPINLKGYNQIDPSLFIDDDGQAYYIWGQFTLKMARMKPGMKELDLDTVRDSILTESSHHFHEGAFMAKRNGLYYLVYADISRGDTPTCIGYAVSRSPYGPYKYGGVIIDNNYCNPGNWNNHGSIAEFKGQWYVFYHRSTHGCNTMRKACAEPIYFNPDGSINEVEMTSQGAGGPLKAEETIEAEWACLLRGNLRVEQFSESAEKLGQTRNSDRFCIKYVDFSNMSDSVTVKYSLSGKGGKLTLNTDKPWHSRIATLNLSPSPDGKEWQTVTFKTEKVKGTKALWIQYTGNDDDLVSIDWLRF